VRIDASVSIPDHAHSLIVLKPVGAVGAGFPRPVAGTAPLQVRLGKVIAYFKYQTTKAANELRQTPSLPLWQRGYFEHVIRNERELNFARRYIHNNPLQWTLDNSGPFPVNWN
jgi:REP element-mobilizing transposase RayT